MKAFACLYFPAGLSAPRAVTIVEACLRYSSQVALRDDEAVLLETGKSRWLYGQTSLGLRLQRLAAGEPLLRLRFGDSPAEALALARHDADDVLRLPFEALTDYASPFVDDESAQQLALSLAAPLRALGLRTLGDFLALPPLSLGSRFGPQAPLLRHRVAGHWDMAWPRYEKKELPGESLRLAESAEGQGCASAEALSFALRLLCERLCARLRGRNERVAKLRLGLALDLFPRREQEHVHWDLGLPLALGEARELHLVLRSALEGWLAKGLPGPVLSAHLQSLELAPGLGSQRHFFERREEDIEAFNAVVDRLREHLGPDQVFLAECVQRYLPERAWKKVLREPPPPESPRPPKPRLPERPNRLLRQALPLLCAGDQVALANGRRWQALGWQGPERLQGEWWRDEPQGSAGFARDYFRVSTVEGPDLWVYQRLSGQAPGYWLHGFFD